jgi:hypothetical protein
LAGTCAWSGGTPGLATRTPCGTIKRQFVILVIETGANIIICQSGELFSQTNWRLPESKKMSNFWPKKLK